LALIFVPAFLVSLPFLWSIAGHYLLRIKNPIPLMWSDPQLPPDRWLILWSVMTFTGAAHDDRVGDGRSRAGVHQPTGRRYRHGVVRSQHGSFLYSSYVVDSARRVPLPPIVPAHHFLVYERAAEMVLSGWESRWPLPPLAG
jgi:hypothetical protein